MKHQALHGSIIEEPIIAPHLLPNDCDDGVQCPAVAAVLHLFELLAE